MKQRAGVLIVAAFAAACASSPVWTGGPDGRTARPFSDVGDGVSLAAAPNDDDLRAAAFGGVRTVVDLRAAGEARDAAGERDLAASLGLTYVAIPVPKGDVPIAAADRLDEALSAPGARPALVHCASGQRATAVWALWTARHGGVPPEAALAAADREGIGSALREVLVRRLGER